MEVTVTLNFSDSRYLLQWGHDKIVMEVSATELPAGAGAVPLQWGHDKIVMEVMNQKCCLDLKILASMQ